MRYWIVKFKHQSLISSESAVFVALPPETIFPTISIAPLTMYVDGIQIEVTNNCHPDLLANLVDKQKTMLEFSTGQTVYISCETTEPQKSFAGLAAIVKLMFKLDPYSKCIFAFCNRNRSLIKILQWTVQDYGFIQNALTGVLLSGRTIRMK